MANYLNGIRYVSVTAVKALDMKSVDTHTYDNTTLRELKDWANKDPITIHFKTCALNIESKKYEELAEIALYLSDNLEDEKKLNTFDPDFFYYLDKFLGEMYGQPQSYRQRIIMEDFYKISHDSMFKYLKPADIRYFTNLADSIYYSKKFPRQIDSILTQRKLFESHYR